MSTIAPFTSQYFCTLHKPGAKDKLNVLLRTLPSLLNSACSYLQQLALSHHIPSASGHPHDVAPLYGLLRGEFDSGPGDLRPESASLSH